MFYTSLWHGHSGPQRFFFFFFLIEYKPIPGRVRFGKKKKNYSQRLGTVNPEPTLLSDALQTAAGQRYYYDVRQTRPPCIHVYIPRRSLARFGRDPGVSSASIVSASGIEFFDGHVRFDWHISFICITTLSRGPLATGTGRERACACGRNAWSTVSTGNTPEK